MVTRSVDPGLLKKFLFVLEFVFIRICTCIHYLLDLRIPGNSAEQLQTQAGFPRPLDDRETPKENLRREENEISLLRPISVRYES